MSEVLIYMDFKEEIIKVRTGKVYADFGLKGDPFSVFPEDIIKSFVNREKEFKQLARAVNNLSQGLAPHIVVLGSHGIGKTHFLKRIFYDIKDSKEEIGFKDVMLIDGYQDFKQKFETGKLYSDVLLRVNKGEKILLLFDDLDVIFNRSSKFATEIMDALKYTIIGTWNPDDWRKNKKDRTMSLPKAEVVFLDRLEHENCLEILNKRIESQAINEEGKNLFDDSVKNFLCGLSDGNPYRLITYSHRLLNFMVDNNFKRCDEETFSKFTQEAGLIFIKDLKNEIDQLNERQIEVLKFIIDKREVNSMELAAYLMLSRSSAVQYLQSLLKKNLLESKIKDKETWYYIPTEIEYDIMDYVVKKDTKKIAEV